MCKVKTPNPNNSALSKLPPPRATVQAPVRAGATAAATARTSGAYASRSQIPQFALPYVTAKLGGQTAVLGG